MRKVTTGCCALCQLDKVNNETSMLDIAEALKILKKEKEENTEVGVTTGNGQTAVFVIVTRGEDILENNLIRLGFTNIWEFERRKGYNELSNNPGNLKMYIKNL